MLSGYSVFAQFIQDGITLEYKGNQAKQPYTDLVSFDFAGAANTVNIDGKFSLKFNTLSLGNMVGDFSITVANKQYVLFNKPTLQRWILTRDASMEVLLCKKSHIDNLVNAYTKVHVSKLEKQFNEAKEEIEKQIKENERLKIENTDLTQRLNSLAETYKRQLAQIKASAIMFAYIDETKLDSLENLKRNYILVNNLEKAIEVGREINYAEIAKGLLYNASISHGSYQENIDKLFNVVGYIQQHINNCYIENPHWFAINYKFDLKKSNKQELVEYYQIIADIYSYLIKQFTSFIRCDEHFLLNLRRAYGDVLFKIVIYSDIDEYRDREKYFDLLLKAAEHNSPDALYKLGTSVKDSNQARSYLKRCLEVVDDELLKDYALERYESFPDFSHITKQHDTIYFHIISDETKEVCISDFSIGEARSIITLPEYVKYRGDKYIITKIGYQSFSKYPWAYKDEYKIILPSKLIQIGRAAFDLQNRLNAIEFPTSLRVIKDYAFNDCWSLKKIIIPEGVVEIGDMAFNNMGWSEVEYCPEEETIISLPSTLKKIERFSFRSWFVGEVKLNPRNPNFRLINGVLYSADTTKVYNELIPVNTKVLYLPDEAKLSDIYTYHADSLIRYEIDSTHKYYTEYRKVIYTKDFEEIVSIPKDLDTLDLHPNVKRLYMLYWPENMVVKFNKSQSIDIMYELMLDYVNLYKTKSAFQLLSADNVLISYEEAALLLEKYVSSVSDSVIDNWSHEECWTELAKGKINECDYDTATRYYSYLKKDFSGFSSLLVDIGYQKYSAGAYDIAYEMWLLAAQEYSNAMAAYNVGVMFQNGTLKEIDMLKAITWYERAISLNDQNVSAYIALGRIYYSDLLGHPNYVKAFECFEKAGQLGNAEALNYMGLIYANGLSCPKNTRKAIQCFEGSIEKGDKKYAPFNLGLIYLYDKAHEDYEEAYDKILLAAHNDNIGAMNQLAYMYSCGKGTERNMQDALWYINKAIDKDPNNLNLYDTKGELSIMNGDIKTAREIWNNIISVDSLFAQSHNTNLGKSIVKDNDYDVYVSMIELGDSINSPYNLGRLYLANDDVVNAKKYFDIAANHNHELALATLGQLAILGLPSEGLAGNERIEAAIEYFGKAIDYGYDGEVRLLNYERVYTSYAIAQAAFLRTEYEIAKTFFEDAMTTNADSLLCSNSAVKLGIMYLNGYDVRKNLNKAKDYFEKAISLYNTSSFALGSMAILYLEEGNNDLAVKYFCDAINHGAFEVLKMILEDETLTSLLAYTAEVINKDTPAGKLGLHGEYYLLSFDDWNLLDSRSIYDVVKQKRGLPKTIVIMRDGEIFKHTFEDNIGVQIEVIKVDTSTRKELLNYL